MKEFRYCSYKQRKIRLAICNFAKALRNKHIITINMYADLVDYLLW